MSYNITNLTVELARAVENTERARARWNAARARVNLHSATPVDPTDRVLAEFLRAATAELAAASADLLRAETDLAVRTGALEHAMTYAGTVRELQITPAGVCAVVSDLEEAHKRKYANRARPTRKRKPANSNRPKWDAPHFLQAKSRKGNVK